MIKAYGSNRMILSSNPNARCSLLRLFSVLSEVLEDRERNRVLLGGDSGNPARVVGDPNVAAKDSIDITGIIGTCSS